MTRTPHQDALRDDDRLADEEYQRRKEARMEATVAPMWRVTFYVWWRSGTDTERCEVIFRTQAATAVSAVGTVVAKATLAFPGVSIVASSIIATPETV